MNPISRDLFIDGQWIPSSSGKTYNRYNPSNGELVGTFPLATSEDAERAIFAARQSFDSGVWSAIDSEERALVMLQTAEILLERAEEIAWWEYATTGTPLRYTKNFANSAARLFRYYAGLARDISGRNFNFNEKQMGLILQEPIGVCSLIVPWNFPLGEAAWKVCPALAAGCSMVVKPDSKTPITALELGIILKEAGLPDGVYNAIVGDVEDVGIPLTTHPDIDHISFTGSTHSGRQIMNAASSTLKPLHLELGGKSPLIIFEDADLDKAAADSAFGIFWHLGQVCTASSRILIERSAVDKFVHLFQKHTENMQVGDPLAETSVLGSLVSEDHLKHVLAYVDRGRNEGATLVTGGERLTEGDFANGAFMKPVIFTDVTPQMTIAQEEIFGPVAAIIPFDSPQEALSLANDTQYGLGAGVWTKNMNIAMHMSRKLHAGTVWINGYGADRHEMPWGGYKQSGFGRELGREGLYEFLHSKSVHIQLDDWQK